MRIFVEMCILAHDRFMRNVELFSVLDHLVSVFYDPLTQLSLDNVVVPLQLALYL